MLLKLVKKVLINSNFVFCFEGGNEKNMILSPDNFAQISFSQLN